MDFANFFQQLGGLLGDLVTEHWLKLIWIPIAAVAGWFLKRWKDGRAWRKRHFLQRVNCSLNLLDGDTLRIRTFFEMPLRDILLGNETAMRRVLAAAQRTSKENPFLALPEAESWHVLNAVLNEISERCALGTLAADMGLPVRRAPYVFGLTCERDDDVKVRKLRIMLVRSELIERIRGKKAAAAKFESPSHHVRWRTLQTMATHRDRLQLMPIELALPLPSSRQEIQGPETPLGAALEASAEAVGAVE
ncbi:MAG: hypothetical protein WD066_14945 [Planctomycetaceae bacterium]